MVSKVDDTTYTGRCYCNAVQFQVKGDVKVVTYCHCHMCRGTHSTEGSHQVVYGADDFKITAGQENIATFQAPKSIRYFCSKCGSRTHRLIPSFNAMVIFPSTFDVCNGADGQSGGTMPDEWKPQVHVFYGSRAQGHEYDDGLPFARDAPTSLGGTGVMMDWRGNLIQDKDQTPIESKESDSMRSKV